MRQLRNASFIFEYLKSVYYPPMTANHIHFNSRTSISEQPKIQINVIVVVFHIIFEERVRDVFPWPPASFVTYQSHHILIITQKETNILLKLALGQSFLSVILKINHGS